MVPMRRTGARLSSNSATPAKERVGAPSCVEDFLQEVETPTIESLQHEGFELSGFEVQVVVLSDDTVVVDVFPHDERPASVSLQQGDCRLSSREAHELVVSVDVDSPLVLESVVVLQEVPLTESLQHEA